jgi:glycosyltransferase involved in cell wall biosynthesis
MHILFLSDCFPPEVNAPASRTHEHAREWVRAGHRVTVITCAPNFPYGKLMAGYQNRLVQREVLDGIEVIRVWSYMTANEGFWLRSLDFASFMLSATLASLTVRQPSVVVATSPQFFAAVAGWMVSTHRRCPFVFEVRDLWPEQIVANGVLSEGPTIRSLKAMAQFLYSQAALVVTVGEGYRDQLLASYHLSREKMRVVPNGILPEQFSAHGRREAARQQYGWADRFVVLYLGTHGLSQKLETVLGAARILRDRPDVLFVFVGEGARKAAIKEIAEREGLANCQFWPQQPKAVIPDLYEAADACVVPLRRSPLYTGNYPSKMFEAMAMQCPIILSADGQSRALLERAGAGIAVEPENEIALAEAVTALQSDPARVASMRAQGRQFVVREYSRRHWAERYLDVLHEAVAMGTPRTPNGLTLP